MTDEIALPASIELAWGRHDRPRRGPKPALTLDQVVAAGIEVARTEGIAALSMSRVAAQIGSSTMALYRYVAAKDDLLTLMVDSALGPPPAIGAGADWRAGLTAWCRTLRTRYQTNPWALKVPISGPPLAPNNVAWLDNALQCQAETVLTEQQKLSATLLLSGFVRNEATLMADFAESAPDQPIMSGYGDLLRVLTTAQDYPALHRAIDSQHLDDDDDPDVEFAFGLDRILDGLQMLMDA